jgi:Leucine-rich repeat (LRR) protein
MSLTLPKGLTNLISLYLHGNQLTSLTLPAGLTNLTTLYLHGNQLTSLTLPGDLMSLTTLYLHGNQLTSLTLPLGLTSLTVLDLHDNQLTSLTLPADFTNLIYLGLLNTPLQRLVLPEPLAQGALASLVADLVNQGVSVSIYLPRLRLVALLRTTGKTFEFLLTGPPGTYRLQVTQDFSTWTELDSVTIDANESVQVTDPSANSRARGFYRAVRAN